MRDQILAEILWIDKVGHPKTLAPRLAVVVDIDPDDHLGAGEPQTLQHVEPDTTQAKDDRLGALLDLGGIDDRANAGGDAAADVADLIERRVVSDFCHRDLRQHGEVRKRRCAHVVMDRLAAARKSRGAIGHQALALGGANRSAEVGFARQT